MANTNIQAVQFANTRIRPFVDQLYSAYLTAKSLLDQWNAQGVPTVIPNDAIVIADGAAVDGRPPMTDAQANNIINRATELINWMEQGLVASPFTGTITNSTLNTVSGLQVNGRPLF